MSVLFSFPLLWSQAAPPGVPAWLFRTIVWLFVYGEPALTIQGVVGGLILWLKVMSLFCLLGWVVSWVTAALKERSEARGHWHDLAAILGVAAAVGAVVLRVLESTRRVEWAIQVGQVPLTSLLAIVAGVLTFLWVESTLWRTIRRLGRASDVAVLVGMHLALGLGLGLGLALQRTGILRMILGIDPKLPVTWQDGMIYGARLGATYMGYVVLARVVGLVARELVAIRWRRLVSIAWLTTAEANRRMWAPWVVLTVFLVVLAFTHWFLQAPRAAEMGRLFVGTLALLCSLLITVMVTLLTPLSLPTDIQQQTISTVVSKPVRRIELIWGRMLGFMTIVTVLVLAFGGISLFYLWRTVGGAIRATDALAAKEARAGRTTQANHLREEAEQLRARMAAREPFRGSLTFLDSRGNFHLRGIDVGQEQSTREPRSHIEGGTVATAIWTFGRVIDPYDPNRRHILDYRIPVERLLVRDSIEGLMDRVYEIQERIAAAERERKAPNVSPERAKQLSDLIARDRDELRPFNELLARRRKEAEALKARAQAEEDAKRPTEAEAFRRREAALHSRPIPLEMTFNVYRTTKGKLGEPVFAKLVATNPRTGASYENVFPIREYYTNKQYLPASILAGSRGDLRVEIRCLSPTQYLGMAESDLYVLAYSGDFGTNYMKGLFGVWLQAMVLSAIGVFAGTFLSWSVALLTTIAFFVAGEVAFGFLLQFTQAGLLGGGPFESLIRLLSHDNQMTELAPTLAVITAKTLDAIVLPVMSRLVYIVPNFSALDLSDTVSNGFAVSWGVLGADLLLALAYALPFSLAGYFILKNREIAA